MAAMSSQSPAQSTLSPEHAAPAQVAPSVAANQGNNQGRYGNSFMANQAGFGSVSDWMPDLGSWFGEEEQTPEEIALKEQQDFLIKTWPPMADFDTGTGGTFDGQLIGNLLVVTLKVAYDFQPGNAANAPKGTPPAELQWNAAEEAVFRADFSKKVEGSWSFQHPIRSTRPLWTTQLMVAINVIEDAADPHFTLSIEKLPADAGDGPASVCDDGYHHAPGDACDPNAPGVDGGTAVLDSRDNAEGRVRNGSQALVSLQFRRGRSDIVATEATKLDAPATSLVANPAWDVEVTGHTSTSGDETQNFLLARQREQAVSAALKTKGVKDDQLIHEVMGEQDAGRTAADQRVDVHVLDAQTQVTSAHESGHMFGLADEYIPTGGAAGDALNPEYQQLLRDNAELPGGAVPTAQESDSIMSNGMRVDSWHYAPFVALVKAITGSPEWTV